MVASIPVKSQCLHLFVKEIAVVKKYNNLKLKLGLVKPTSA
jgi:hypothetical protein